MNGGQALVATLLSHGVEAAFCLPGESYLEVIEALRLAKDRLRLINTRHESGASFAAAAYGRITGRPGIAFVTRGPGATNASIGVHTATQDSVPMVLFIGQVPTTELGREAFQEIDYARMFGGLAKAVFEPRKPTEVAAMTAQALTIACAGRPGPVIVSLPEDVTENDAGDVAIPRPSPRQIVEPDAARLNQVADLIRNARAPLIIAGEQIGFEGAQAALIAFAEKTGAGVVAAFRRQGVMPSDHAAYLGHIGLALTPYQKEMMKEVDLIIALGSRFDGATSIDFSLVESHQTLIQIFPDAKVLGRTRAAVPVLGDVAPTLAGLSARLSEPPPNQRQEWRARWRDKAVAFMRPEGQDALGRVDQIAVMKTLGARLPHDATITNDAGNFSTWLHRYMPFRQPSSQAAPCCGAMGYAVAGAIGAQIARPGKTVLAMVGDGGFLMTGQELITAVEHDLPIKILLCDNAAYGTIVMHQQRRFGPGHNHAVAMKSPDFAAAARAWGAAAYTVDDTAGFAPALDAALAHKGPALIHLKTDLRDLAASGLKLSA
ncbi:MAG: thiamine pyrophosphate-binding protein [Alphaproteobacteria bacterium]|nr:thiamine pyrophosphate-binding protein [Alphaproteobacteria bacterium]